MHVHLKFTILGGAILSNLYWLVSPGSAFPQKTEIKVSQQSPVVSRVDPPNWWAGSSVNPVRFLITGSGLTGSEVTADGHGIVAGKPTVTGDGRYLFVNVTIARWASLGAHALKIVTPHGSTRATFDVDKPLATTGRFQGFSPDDVIYLVMVDRFADGDTTNDDPASAPGLYSRTNLDGVPRGA